MNDNNRDDLERLASSPRLTFTIEDDIDNNEDEDDDEHHNNNHHHSLSDYPSHMLLHNSKDYQKIKNSSSKQRCSCFSLIHGLITFTLAIALGFSLYNNHQEEEKPTSSSTSSIESTTGISTIPWASLPKNDKTLTRFAFGSCSYQKVPQPHWDTLSKFQPNITILMGDNVYGDCSDDSCTELIQAYKDWSQHPSFYEAAKILPIIATLDNHDYGMANAHDTNPYKDIARSLFLDFFNIPTNDIRRQRQNNDDGGGGGVYTSYEWGPIGQRVQVLLLDTRYSRSKFKDTNEPGAPGKEQYMPYEDHDYHNNDDEIHMLSKDQWSWLHHQLDQPANLRLLVSSIQVVADGTGFDCWRMIPKERNKLYKALSKAESNSRILILSGDRHLGGIYRNHEHHINEITSSSFTHTIPLGAFSSCATSEQCDEKDERRINDFVHVNNFGLIDIDWDIRMVTVTIRRVGPTSGFDAMEGRSEDGEILQMGTWRIP